MSDYRNPYNESSSRVTQQAVKSTAAPQGAYPVQPAPQSYDAAPQQPAAPVRRRRSERHIGEEAAPVPQTAPIQQSAYQASQEYAQPAQPQWEAQRGQWAHPQQPNQWENQDGQWVRQQAGLNQEETRQDYYPPRSNQRSPYVNDSFSRRPAMLEDDYDDEDEERRSPWLKILLIVLAVLIAMAAALYFIPMKEEFFLYPAKQLVEDGVDSVKGLFSGEKDAKEQVYAFETIQNNGLTNSRLMFRLTTTKNVPAVQIRDDAGNEIPATINLLSSKEEELYTWNIITEFASPFQGNVHAWVQIKDEWMDSGYMVSLAIQSPTLPPSLPTPAPTMAPTQAPTQVPAQASFVTNAPLAIATWAPTNPPAPTLAPTLAPTPAPTMAPTLVPTQVPTPPPTATPIPTATPAPTKTPLPQLAAEAGDKNVKMTDTVYKGGTSQSDYQRENGYMAPHPDDYSYYPAGVLTFRGDNFRRNAAFGTVEVENEKLSILWKSEIGSMRTADSGTLYGVGWSGQPAIVKWSKQSREMMESMYDEKQATSAFREVIFGAQDGKIYFLDLDDGSASRDPINIGYPIKGSVSIDTYLRPMLAVGQAISKLPSKQGDIGLHLFNLYDNEKILINGRKSNSQKQYSTNGAFDGTPLFLYSFGQYANDALIMAGENGLLYTIDLNPTFDYPSPVDPEKEGKLELKLDTYYLRSKISTSDEEKAKNQVGVESSVAMYNQYIYLADTYGLVRCVDSNTMKTVWAVDTGDNVDAAIALDMDGDQVALYTGNTAYTRLGSKKDVTIRRLDALTGNEIWSYSIKCDYDKNQLSGCKASPVVGQHEIADLVIFTVNQVDGGGSRIIAFKKDSGKIAWQYDMAADTVSSPVAVYNEAGEAWIIQADGDGVLYLLDGATGSLRNKLDLGGSIQGSPAVYRDILVIGTCSKENSFMYGIKID